MTSVPPLVDEVPLDQYVSTAGQTDFNFTYMIFATTDIKVYINGVLKTITTDYTVKTAGGATITSADLPIDGGKVVFITPLALNDAVSLSRDIPISRLTGYSVAGAFRADVVNAEFTKIYAVMQQLERDLFRGIVLTPFDAAGASLVLPASRANSFLAFDADGDIIASAGSVTEAIVSSYMATLLDDTTAAAARTTLGVVIGTNVQAWDAQLDTLAALASVANLSALAGLTGAANKVARFTGAGAMELVDLVSASESVAGIVELLTNAELAAGTDTTRAATAASIASLFANSDRSATGYAKLPVKVGGAFVEIIVQWGEDSFNIAHTASKVVTLPIAFPTANLQTIIGQVSNSSTVNSQQMLTAKTTANFTFQYSTYTAGSYAGILRYIAIGY